MISSWTGEQLAQITGGRWYHDMPQTAPLAIEIDHRCLGNTGLFVALAGERQDGHAFLAALDSQHCALVKTPCQKSNAAQLQVDDTLAALHQLAKAAMRETTAQKIAITGSVGKTSTKEALLAILSCFGATHASKGNYNNHIGAPLSMARTPDEAETIIMEMGMNHKGEISPLSHLFDADIAIITKIADSHIGHFTSLEEIAYAKAEIFDGMTSGIAILPYDDAHFDLLADYARARGLTVISFGASHGADIQLRHHKAVPEGRELVIARPHKQDITVQCGLSAPHHAAIILIAIAILDARGLDWQHAKDTISSLQEVTGRGDRQDIALSGRRITFINDSYNAGPASMAASLSYVASLPHAKKAIILTEMRELGAKTASSHAALAPAIEAISPHCLVLVGEGFEAMHEALRTPTKPIYHSTAASAERTLLSDIADCDLVLIKGSNGSGAPHLAAHLLAAGTSLSHLPSEAQYVS